MRLRVRTTATLLTMLFLVSMIFSVVPVSAAPGDTGIITLDDDTTSLNFYAGPPHGGTTPDAWAYPDTDTWELTIATSYEAKVKIEWFDWYPDNRHMIIARRRGSESEMFAVNLDSGEERTLAVAYSRSQVSSE